MADTYLGPGRLLTFSTRLSTIAAIVNNLPFTAAGLKLNAAIMQHYLLPEATWYIAYFSCTHFGNHSLQTVRVIISKHLQCLLHNNLPENSTKNMSRTYEVKRVHCVILPHSQTRSKLNMIYTCLHVLRVFTNQI